MWGVAVASSMTAKGSRASVAAQLITVNCGSARKQRRRAAQRHGVDHEHQHAGGGPKIAGREGEVLQHLRMPACDDQSHTRETGRDAEGER